MIETEPSLEALPDNYCAECGLTIHSTQMARHMLLVHNIIQKEA